MHRLSVFGGRIRSGIKSLAITLGILSLTACAGGFGGTAASPLLTIITQPQSQTVVAGRTATFTVAAAGTGPISYQWSVNGTAIAGAESTSYTTPATTAADSGTVYKAVASNEAGTAASSAATLTVTTPPTITTQPVSASVYVGQTATFYVAATGTGPLTYQWYLAGAPIAGATSNTYTTPATVLNNNGAI